MSFLREPGDLSRTPLAAILLEAWSLRATGELTVSQPGGNSRLFFRDGMPVGAQTFAGFHPLGQMLLGRGLIDIDTLGRSLAEMAGSRRRQGDVLVEMGAVSQEVVDRALEDQQAGYLSLIAGLSEGAFRFDFDAAIPAWAVRVLVAPMRAVVDALDTPQGEALCASALALAEGPIALSHRHGDISLVFSWTGPEEEILHRLETASTASEILATPGIPQAHARAVLAALLLLGVAETAGEVVDLGALGAQADPLPQPRPARPAPAAGPPPVLAPAVAGTPRPRSRPRPPSRHAGATRRSPGPAGSGCSPAPCRTWASAPSRRALRPAPLPRRRRRHPRPERGVRRARPGPRARSGRRSRPRFRWPARPTSSPGWGCRAAPAPRR